MNNNFTYNGTIFYQEILTSILQLEKNMEPVILKFDIQRTKRDPNDPPIINNFNKTPKTLRSLFLILDNYNNDSQNHPNNRYLICNVDKRPSNVSIPFTKKDINDDFEIELNYDYSFENVPTWYVNFDYVGLFSASRLFKNQKYPYYNLGILNKQKMNEVLDTLIGSFNKII